MGYIRIVNKGEIDINALTLLGASSKEGDSTKIGFFGSGNKYALATFMRKGVGVRIFSGDTEFVIETEDVNFRGTGFERIVINGVRTSLTTRTGPEWELWMAVREFLCNAIDEGGYSWASCDEAVPANPGETAIYIENTGEIEIIFDNIEDILILDELPITTVSTTYGAIAIYERDNGKAYRKGICCSSRHEKSLFAYSFENISINESRVVQCDYYVQEQIASAFAACDNHVIIHAFFAKMLEGVLDNASINGLIEEQVLAGSYWDSCYCTSRFSYAWKQMILAYNKELCPDGYRSVLPAEDLNHYIIVPEGFYTRITGEFPELPRVGDGDTSWYPADPSEKLKGVVAAALDELKVLGIHTEPSLTILFGNFINDNTIARCSKDGTIRISVKYDESLDYSEVLLEELTHKKTGLNDGSRALQNFLFKSWLNAERRTATVNQRIEEIVQQKAKAASRSEKFRELVASALELTENA